MADDLETEKFPPEGALSARTDGQSEPDLVPASVRQKDSERRESGRRRWAIVGAMLCVAVLAGWLGMLSHSDIWQKQLLKNLKNRLRGCWPLRQQACFRSLHPSASFLQRNR